MESLVTAFAKDPVLTSERLILRKLTKNDAADIYAYAGDPEVSRYLLWSAHSSLAVTKRYLDQAVRQYRHGDLFDFAVVLRKENRVIGTCGFTSCREASSAGEVGYVLSPAYRGQGLATEAVMLLLRWGFCHLKMNRIEARYMVENTASRALMERCGMKPEGVFRQLLYVKGAYRDIGVCAILRSEFIAAFGEENAAYAGQRPAALSNTLFFGGEK